MNLLRHKASIVDWNSFVDDNIDIYAEYINFTILSVAKKNAIEIHVSQFILQILLGSLLSLK